ncbi:replication restart helicase PriA [Roseivirga pacifica]|uniref:replication restart helicase PriA n=1 Tax=Roseivirga pacifica TaxID=1267423 RepID=UPI002094426E|nr:primosomal protein N' [Roseivirga pacifica]MCO6357352.1 primosomal protein N' [Roseivirga pacifica]MCO6367934.1 primosomal protein N' [Roseivirga pacifica]MCO6369584.1 primosomal protein N' [Roseivirga pacifica]MCO6373438.1 primosomal protein N' [Roseivirga pacifica]MCO6377305.1 primosomal protein N' [Roseivirga pacifica]
MSSLQLNLDAPENDATLFVDVALPIPIPQLYTYRVPAEFEELAKTGIRCIVQFGRQKVVTGVIMKVHHKAPEIYTAKPLLDIMDAEPVLTETQIKFMQWLAKYYMATFGEVLNAALPSGLKLSSESRIQLHPDNDWNDSDYPFDDKELILLNTLESNDSLTYREAADALELKSAYKYIKSLVQKEVIIIYEELKEKYKPKKVKKIRLVAELTTNSEDLEAVFQALEKKPKQTDILLKYLQEVPVYQKPEMNEFGIEKSVFTDAGFSTSSLNTLIKNNILEAFEVIVSRFDEASSQTLKTINLSERQEQAKAEILAQFEEKSTVLLHGVTGSGKTEIYIQLIKEVVDSGQQALYLLPEIAITAQIVNRLKAVFGDRMGVFHSKFSDNERVEVWQGLLDGRFDFIIGVRSAIFLPFAQLGLIVVDEEHENSYKQFDPAPRYHARDAALVLSHFHHAKTILGSATPSIESFTNAKQDKYGLVTIAERFHNAGLPEIKIADIAEEKKKKKALGDFTSVLINELREVLERKEQAIIFQNRRGYSSYVNCDDCGYIPTCHRCDVSLTYHQYKNQVICHYCGHKEVVPVTCPACGSTNIRTVGIGTEKIEEELKLLLPEAKIQRMDLETTRSKYAYQNIIHDFEKGEIDILVGTQMVSKGLDFDKVSLVGVFDIDRMIHFPDFRSQERTFQLVTQVSGRAGRREKKGTVVIQTRNPDLRILEWIWAHDYHTFYKAEMEERNSYNYPPFTRMIHLLVRSKDKQNTHIAAGKLANMLKEDIGGKRVLGPQEPIISKIRDKYLMDIFLKIEKKYNIEFVKERIENAKLELLKDKELKTVEIIPDVDPS